METIYSLILWDKMKRKPAECQIHKMPLEEIEADFKKYMASVTAEQFKKDIEENSLMSIQENELYYDGQFYEFNDSIHNDQLSPDPSSKDRTMVKFVYHETMAESTILRMMMEHLNPDSSAFLARLHEEWYKKRVKEDEQNS